MKKHGNHGKHDEHEHGELIGDILVSGKDKIEIPLNHEPKHVHVYFKDESVPVPCNPPHSNELEWEIKHEHHHKKIFLVIKWNVFETAVIVYKVTF